MTVVTVKVAVEPQVEAVKTAMTANMILLLTDPSAVIRPGMSMVLIVLLLKAITTGIVQAVNVLVIVVAQMVALMVVQMVAATVKVAM